MINNKMDISEFLQNANYTKKNIGCGCNGHYKRTWIIDIHKITSELKDKRIGKVVTYYINGRIATRELFIDSIKFLL